MSIALTTNIPVPNVTRARVRKFTADPDTSTASALVEVGGAGGRVYSEYICNIANGDCQGVRANGSSVAYTDIVQQFTLTVATGYTDILAAFTANGNLATKLRAVETAMQTAGLLPAGVVS